MNYRSDLLDTVENYFTWIESHVPERVADSFSTDASVVDNGHTYTGRDKILCLAHGRCDRMGNHHNPTLHHHHDVGGSRLGHYPRDRKFSRGQVDLHHELALDSDGLIRTLTITA